MRFPGRRALNLSMIGPLRWPVVLPILVMAGGLTGFAALLEEVGEGEGEAHRFDEAVLLAFRTQGDPADPLGPLWLEIAMGDLTALGSIAVLLFITIVVTGFLLLTRRAGGAVLVVVAVLGGVVLSSLLKIGIDRPRPDLVAPLADVHTMSFPSGHAMLSAVTYLTLGTLLASMTRERSFQLYVLAVAVATTIIVGLTRLYLGVHWPTDVLAGWCVGAAWAMLCWLVRAALLRRSGRLRPSKGSANEKPGTAQSP